METRLEKLREFGLTHEEAVESLDASNGDIHRAIEYHFSKSNSNNWTFFQFTNKDVVGTIENRTDESAGSLVIEDPLFFNEIGHDLPPGLVSIRKYLSLACILQIFLRWDAGLNLLYTKHFGNWHPLPTSIELPKNKSNFGLELQILGAYANLSKRRSLNAVPAMVELIRINKNKSSIAAVWSAIIQEINIEALNSLAVTEITFRDGSRRHYNIIECNKSVSLYDSLHQFCAFGQAHMFKSVEYIPNGKILGFHAGNGYSISSIPQRIYIDRFLEVNADFCHQIQVDCVQMKQQLQYLEAEKNKYNYSDIKILETTSNLIQELLSDSSMNITSIKELADNIRKSIQSINLEITQVSEKLAQAYMIPELSQNYFTLKDIIVRDKNNMYILIQYSGDKYIRFQGESVTEIPKEELFNFESQVLFITYQFGNAHSVCIPDQLKAIVMKDNKTI